MNNTDIHPIQSMILCDLLFVEEVGFAKLNKKKLGSDQFSFHLRQLTDWKLIEKTENGKYRLTAKGKEFANQFDTQAMEIERQPKIAVLVVGTKRKKGQVKYLVQQRLKQPYYGYWGFISGKVRWGEKILETGGRELEEEAGLRGDLELVGMEHKTDLGTGGEILEDKYFLILKAEKLEGELKTDFEAGKNCFKTKAEILMLPDLFDDVAMILEKVEGGKFEFEEKEYRVKRY
ncbi:MAG: NUDIX domain-containing protein [Candidatus Shapirobacteria bacterium]|jgi:ADP-ribose pyrophosphatase YjhB (NUDIX family)